MSIFVTTVVTGRFESAVNTATPRHAPNSHLALMFIEVFLEPDNVNDRRDAMIKCVIETNAPMAVFMLWSSVVAVSRKQSGKIL